MSLLSEALKLEATRVERPVDDRLREECELAVAYYAGRVYCGQVAKILGFEKTSAVGSWAAGVVMKGVRAEIIKLVMKPQCPCWSTGEYKWVDWCKDHPQESMT